MALAPSPTPTTNTQKPPETNHGTVTSWIPLTTAWPSSSGCEKSFWSYVSNTIAGWDPGYGISVNPSLSCWPPAGTTWWDGARLGANSLTAMLLGPVTCPEAYFTATTSVKNEESTFVGCCPSGYKFAHVNAAGGTGECTSDVKPGQVLTYAIRDVSQSWYTTSLTANTSTTVAGIQFNGWKFAQATSTSAHPNTSSQIPGSGSSPTASLGSGSGGLSTGAKVGIGVGVVAGVVALLSLLGGFFLRMRRRNGARGAGIRELSELPGSHHMAHEVEVKERPQEIDSRSRPPAELEGD